MKIKSLVGKSAIRTAPNKIGDHSYMTSHVNIIDADETHIFTKQGNGSDVHILDCYSWDDDNWNEFKDQECGHEFSKIVGFRFCCKCGSKIK